MVAILKPGVFSESDIAGLIHTQLEINAVVTALDALRQNHGEMMIPQFPVLAELRHRLGTIKNTPDGPPLPSTEAVLEEARRLHTYFSDNAQNPILAEGGLSRHALDLAATLQQPGFLVVYQRVESARLAAADQLRQEIALAEAHVRTLAPTEPDLLVREDMLASLGTNMGRFIDTIHRIPAYRQIQLPHLMKLGELAAAVSLPKPEQVYIDPRALPRIDDLHRELTSIMGSRAPHRDAAEAAFTRTFGFRVDQVEGLLRHANALNLVNKDKPPETGTQAQR